MSGQSRLDSKSFAKECYEVNPVLVFFINLASNARWFPTGVLFSVFCVLQ